MKRILSPLPADGVVSSQVVHRHTRACSLKALDMRLETHTFDDDGRFPNSALPVLLYRGAIASDAGAATHERLFAGHGWLGAWRDGIFDFHHFHSTTHEVLGIAAGRANVVLGGPHGRRFELVAGDVVVLPAGTGHCNAGSPAGLLVVGAYPNGMRWDIRRGDPHEREEVLANIARVPLPDQDPVQGKGGPLVELWSRVARGASSILDRAPRPDNVAEGHHNDLV